MEMKKLPLLEAFAAVTEWASAAKRNASSSSFPSLEPLRYLLDKPNPSILGIDPGVTTLSGQVVIGLRLLGARSVGNERTRYVLPIHFAMIRAFEIIPGARIKLDADSHAGDRAKRNVQRPQEKLIYPMNIHLPPAFAKSLDIRGASRLDRILHNAPPDARLHSKRTGNFRLFAPSESVLLEYRGDPLLTQHDWLRFTALALEKGGHKELQNLTDVLRSLFVTADRWHWDELDGRLESDPRWDDAKAD